MRVLFHPVTKVLLALLILGVVVGGSIFGYYYIKFSKLIDRRLASGVFARTSRIYSAPEAIFSDQDLTVGEIEIRLRRSGYTESKTNRVGWYQEVKGGLEIFPGPESYFQDEPALVRIADGKIQKIVSLKDNTEQQRYELEPELITNLFDRSREKRRLIRFEDIPPNLVNALLAAEDRTFFQHAGIDFTRIIGAAIEDIRSGNRNQGASTITQQLARGFFLTPARTFRRKIAEALIALQLERKLSKRDIFEFYCNHVYMGQRGSFSINGVAEGSLAYFGKDVRQLTLPEAAFLAGIIRGPNIYNPYKYEERVRDRRNRILDAMLRLGAITQLERDEAAAAPVRVVPPSIETGDAPYFVDLVREQLLERYPEKELTSNTYRIYTTLDMNLQRAAGGAVRAGIQFVDEQLAKKKTKRKLPQAQVALVAIDPHTGEVKALVGGRSYGASQLNHAVAMRQPGSAFKPFVYAAAFDSAVDGARPLVTANTVVDDSPTTFIYDGGTYEPSNYQEKFRGDVTAREALAHSLNVATVKIGEMAGFDKVIQLAHAVGLKTARATPAVALGSYEASPVDIAAAYTAFANGGNYLDAFMIRAVKNQAGETIEQHKMNPKNALDPRVAALMTSLLQGVVQYGTAAGVRSRGFTAPAAGKTGTSHDGWFAGYTSNLLCVVWVGFDDNSELPLSGAQSALPIWTEFMKRASGLRPYRNMVDFDMPTGMIEVEIDPLSNQVATPFCPDRRVVMFIDGSQPGDLCMLHNLQRASAPGALLPAPLTTTSVPHPPGAGTAAAPRAAPPLPGSAAAGSPATTPAAAQPAPTDEKKKKGIFGRIIGVFSGGDNKEPQKPKPQQP